MVLKTRPVQPISMSNLSQQISESLKEAMKAKDQVTLSTLRSLKSAIQLATIEKHGADGQLEDPEVIAVIRKAIKQRHDSISSFRDAGRADLAEKEEAEIKVLERYLPQPLSREEMELLVAEVIGELGVTLRKDMGKVMKLLGERAGGRADNKVLSQMVMERLV
jgi:uncharacterized protein